MPLHIYLMTITYLGEMSRYEDAEPEVRAAPHEFEYEFREYVHSLSNFCYHVFPFSEAPEILRGLSQCGGDEDYLALFHKDLNTPFWMERLSCCTVDEFIVDDWKVVISAHA